MHQLHFSTDTLRRSTSSVIFQRGQDYAATGAVLSLSRREHDLVAAVRGSDPIPYEVRVELDDDEFVAAWCDCPFDQGGWCKHIVAVLLVASADPAAVMERPSLATLLDPLDPQQLRTLIERLAAGQPSVIDAIERELIVVTATAAPAPEAVVEIDVEVVRRRVRATIHSVSHMRPSEAYWHTSGVVSDVRLELDPVRELIGNSHGALALALLDAITGEYVQSYELLDDSSGHLGDFTYELGNAWTEALLTQELSLDTREHWADRIEEYAAVASNYGINTAFAAALDAARHGWDEVVFLREYGTTGSDDDAWATGSYFPEATVLDARLSVLARQERTAEYLRLSAASGRWYRHALMLAGLGRASEAAAVGVEHLRSPVYAHHLAKALHERGAIREALSVAEHGLDLDGPRGEVATLARDLAVDLGDPELAARAALIVVLTNPGLAAYQRLEELSGGTWLEQRDIVLASVRAPSGFATSGSVEILLHENLIDDAIALVSRSADYRTLARVADVALETRPDWVIEVSRFQAEAIMNRAKASHYDVAAHWLARARQAYGAADRLPEWQPYIDELMRVHARKYRLMPHLRMLAG